MGNLVSRFVPPRITELSSRDEKKILTSVKREVHDLGRILLIRQASPWTDSMLIELSEKWGEIMVPVALPPEKEIASVTLVSEEDQVTSATNWHHDQSFAEHPPDWTMLFCREVGGSGAPTVFSDSCGLLSYLSDGFCRVLARQFLSHVAYYPQPGARYGEEIARASHPLIVTVEGNQSGLFAAPATADVIVGWGRDETSWLLNPLFDMLNWPELTVKHDWAKNDLLIWPNRRYAHRALPYTMQGESRSLSRLVGYWKAA
jgi:alpha-ketoglutarate-dependent taurine dioxygenase